MALMKWVLLNSRNKANISGEITFLSKKHEHRVLEVYLQVSVNRWHPARRLFKYSSAIYQKLW